ncbi:MAG: VCBS repeat-containing protein [Flavobacteriales bacterium]|nr:VCBS repeat-containing protein [Flavobacteriales bacterium]
MKQHSSSVLAIAAILFTLPVAAQIAFTANSSLLSGTYGNPSCVVDMNGDHLDDVVRFNGNTMTIAYQQAGGGFVQVNAVTATVNPNWSISVGDLDANGYNDVLIGNGSANSFLRANSDGTAYTEQYFSPYIFSQRTNMADINNDGLLDAWSCHDVGLSKPYRNTGGGVMVEDQSLIQQTVTVGGNYATVFTDYDEDGDLDLYFSKCRSGAPVGDPQRINLLYRNNGNGTWTEVGAQAGVGDGAQSWITVIEDFDNDGDFDMFVGNHSDANRFYRNNGNGTFTDIIATTGINPGALGAWEANGADFDNDGWMDIFTEAGNGIWRNNGNGTFSLFNIGVSEGGIGDLNNDGWMDIHLGQTIRFNNGGTNHWVKFELQGIFSNLNGIGARLKLYGPWGMQTREVRSGNSFSHMSSLHAHFGIGAATQIDSLVIDWPSGVHTVIEAPGIDQLHIVPEAACTLGPIEIITAGGTTICAGGSVQLDAPDGFTSYQWSNGSTAPSITVDQSGNYSVAAFDGNGCAALSNSVVVSVVTSEQPVITILGEEVICQGATVDLVSSVGTNAVWSNGATGATASIGQSGTYTVTADGACGAATSEPVSITVNPAAAIALADDVTIPVPGTADLIAIGDNVKWYADEFGGSAIGTGNAWTTPFVNTTTTFWAETNAQYGGGLQDGGKPDNSGGGGLPSTGSQSFFTAWEPFTIETVTVYAIGAGQRTINLCDAAGAVLQTATFDLADGTHTLTLNFDVPVGVDLSLRCPQQSFFRNNSGVAYPYAIGTMGELTNSGFGTSYYYYFYDWKVRAPMMECPALRDPATVIIGNVGVTEMTAAHVRVFPSPASDIVRVEGVRAGETVSILDAQGRVVLQAATPAVDGAATVNVEKLAPGGYTVQVRSAERNIVRDLVIVR